MQIAVVGAGYVGLTTSACLVKMGHQVVCVEKDEARLAVIKQTKLPFYEPGLDELVFRSISDGRLRLTNDLGAAVGPAHVVFIAVGTPSNVAGEVNLSDLNEVLHALAHLPIDAKVIAIKSTVPIGTTDNACRIITAANRQTEVVFNPEFLREGSAIYDFFHPHRVIIGAHSRTAAQVLASLYEPLEGKILITNPRTAEMIKYASNAFLATKVSFVNQIAAIADQVGADMGVVAAGMGADPRIGPQYLKAGIGFGGSCLPKDLRALIALAREHGVDSSLLEAVLQVNAARRAEFVERVEQVLEGVAGKTLAVFGLAFKGGTSDVRESPAIDIVHRFAARGATVRAFDPVAEEVAAPLVPALVFCPDVYEAAEGADAILILTDWAEFERLDWKRLRRQARGTTVFDGRGLEISKAAVQEGFTYIGPKPHDVDPADHAPAITTSPIVLNAVQDVR